MNIFFHSTQYTNIVNNSMYFSNKFYNAKAISVAVSKYNFVQELQLYLLEILQTQVRGNFLFKNILWMTTREI